MSFIRENSTKKQICYYVTVKRFNEVYTKTDKTVKKGESNEYIYQSFGTAYDTGW